MAGFGKLEIMEVGRCRRGGIGVGILNVCNKTSQITVKVKMWKNKQIKTVTICRPELAKT